jgi:hypothetical protein
MARKKLLSEGEIRQFMKLANLRPIGQDRISEMGGVYGSADQPGDRDMDDPMDDPMGDPMGDPMDDPDEDPGDDDLDMDMDMDAEEDPEELVMSISQDLEKLAAMAGVDMEVSADEDDDMPEPGPPADPDQMMPGMDDDPPGGVYENSAPTEKEIVAEVAKRVISRLQVESRRDNVADQLADRIINKLNKLKK